MIYVAFPTGLIGKGTLWKNNLGGGGGGAINADKSLCIMPVTV